MPFSAFWLRSSVVLFTMILNLVFKGEGPLQMLASGGSQASPMRCTTARALRTLHIISKLVWFCDLLPLCFCLIETEPLKEATCSSPILDYQAVGK